MFFKAKFGAYSPFTKQKDTFCTVGCSSKQSLVRTHLLQRKKTLFAQLGALQSKVGHVFTFWKLKRQFFSKWWFSIQRLAHVCFLQIRQTVFSNVSKGSKTFSFLMIFQQKSTTKKWSTSKRSSKTCLKLVCWTRGGGRPIHQMVILMKTFWEKVGGKNSLGLARFLGSLVNTSIRRRN